MSSLKFSAVVLGLLGAVWAVPTFGQTAYIAQTQASQSRGPLTHWLFQNPRATTRVGGAHVHTVSQQTPELIPTPAAENGEEIVLGEGEIMGPIVDDGLQPGDVVQGAVPGDCVACASSGPCPLHGGPMMDGCYYPGPVMRLLCSGWYRNLDVSFGAHGFKGPADLGRNGNFGFNYALNWGAPLGDPWGIGYQVGARVVHSDFPGHAALTAVDGSAVWGANRTQFFMTAGIFHRPECSRLQWGVVFDWMHDSYYDDADAKQIRSEVSLWLDDRREIGYFGAYGVGDGQLAVDNLENRLSTPLEPTDVFAVFYRRHFSGGGEGRLWVGASGNGDGVLGADATIPLGTSWALENVVTYLSPDEGTGADGMKEESWAVAIRLVWYPGRSSIEAINSKFRPLFRVADNGAFLTDAPGVTP
ncbi:hypothetical protein JCM19992_31140 [Thermostilla marina]